MDLNEHQVFLFQLLTSFLKRGQTLFVTFLVTQGRGKEQIVEIPFDVKQGLQGSTEFCHGLSPEMAVGW